MKVSAEVLWRGLLAGVITAAEATETDPSELLQHASESPVGEHPIDSVGRFAHVFDHENGTTKIREVWRAQQVRCHGQIDRDQGA